MPGQGRAGGSPNALPVAIRVRGGDALPDRKDGGDYGGYLVFRLAPLVFSEGARGSRPEDAFERFSGGRQVSTGHLLCARAPRSVWGSAEEGRQSRPSSKICMQAGQQEDNLGFGVFRRCGGRTGSGCRVILMPLLAVGPALRGQPINERSAEVLLKYQDPAGRQMGEAVAGNRPARG